MKNGVSYTGSMLGGSTKTFKGILEAGETSISFVDTLITGNSTIDYETSKLGVNPTNIEVANNAVTLTFAAQAEDIGIKVIISNDAAEPAPTKMRFLKATGEQYIELSDVCGNEGIKLEFYGYLADYTGGSQGIFGTQWARDCLCVTNSTPSAGSIGIEWERQGATDLLTVPCNKPVYFVFDTNGEVRADEQIITFTPTTYSNKTIKLFCGGDNGAYKGNLWASEMKIYKNNILVKDLIPTKISGEACYYDVIGKKPYFSATSTPFQLEELEYTSKFEKVPFFVKEYSIKGENRTFTVTNPGTYFLIAGTDGTNLHKPVSITINSSNTPYALGGITINNNANATRYAIIDLKAGDTVQYYNQYGYDKYCVALRLVDDLVFDSVQSVNGVLNTQLILSPIENCPCFMFMGSSTNSYIEDNSTITDPESFSLNDPISDHSKWRAIGCYGTGSATLNMSGGSNTAISAISLKLKKKGE